jgi:hypothetical protein
MERADMPKRIPLDERFWSKVDKNGPIPEARSDLGPCWIWTGSRDGKGYGHFRLDGQIQKAHRVAWWLLRGPVPDGHVPDHLCLMTSCVKAIADEHGPAHLEIVTEAENTLRGTRNPTAINARKTHCPAGHPYTPANTYWVNKGRSRRCKTCQMDRQRERRRRVRGGMDVAAGPGRHRA